MKGLAFFLLLIIVIIGGTVYDIVAGIRGSYAYESQVGSYWSLADKSSTIPAKAAYIDKFVAALEQQHFDGSYNAVLFPTPDNSFDRNFEALKSLQGRLHEIEKMDVTSFQYQTAIQQITAQEQGEARPMLEVFEGVWWKQNHFLLWDWVLVLNIIGLIVLVIAAIITGIFAFDDY